MSGETRGDLRRELDPARPFVHRQEEAALALLRTAHEVEQRLACFLRRWELTPTQYNALRILRGAGAAGLACGGIGDRMVTPVPDVTRLLDRLEERGWVERWRDAADRRVVRAAITAAGLDRLTGLDGPLADWLEGALEPLGERRTRELVATLALLRRTLAADGPELQ